MICAYDTAFFVFMSNLTFLDFAILAVFFVVILQKLFLEDMFSRTCQVQNDRINNEKISCVCQKLDFSI